MTEKHHLLTDDEFEKKFSNCTLPGVNFTHEAHLRISYLYITKYGLKTATDKLSEEIAKLDDKYGEGTKFNKACTVSAAKVLNYFIKKTKASDFKSFLNEFPKLKTNFAEAIRERYPLETLQAKVSKKEHLEVNSLAFG